MRRALLLLAVVFFSTLTKSQQPPPEPACNSYVLQKTLTEDPEHLRFKQRLCMYGGNLFSGQAIFGSSFFAGVAQFRNDPPEWGQGMKGYLRRAGSRYAQGATKATGEFVVGAILDEDPRYRPSEEKGFWKRSGYAFRSVFVTRHLKSGKTWPSFSKLTGAAGSGLIGLTWYPDRLNTPGQVLARTGSAYGGYLSSALFQEFGGNIFHLIGKLLGSDSGSSAQPQSKNGGTGR